MNVKNTVENKEQFSVELEIEVSAEEFEAALDRAYKNNRGSISVPGFRKGKAPRKVIEGMYGSGVFYQEAMEEVYPAACEEAIKTKELDVVAAPQVEIIDAGKNGFTFKAEVTVRPEVSLEGYKGLEADKVLATVTDEALDNELKTYVDRASRLEAVERPAQDGDTAVIDFEGFKDGIPFQGGKGENFDLVLGSNSFIPGFEAQVVGMSAGDEKEIEVIFPEDYGMEDLAGKPAAFKVKLHEVKTKIVPELDDEFAKDVSEFDTLDQFKEDLRAKIAERNMAQSDMHFKQALMDKLADKVELNIPAPMVDAQVDRLMRDYAARLESQGISLEMYFSYMQMNEQMMREQLRPNAERQIMTQLALDAVVKAENIQITDEEAREELQKIADDMKVSLEEVEGVLSNDDFKRDLARDRAIKLVVANAKPNLISAEEEKKEAAESEKEEKPEKKAKEKKPAAKKESAAKKTATKKPKKDEAKETVEE